jgi:hypothetical protein
MTAAGTRIVIRVILRGGGENVKRKCQSLQEWTVRMKAKQNIVFSAFIPKVPLNSVRRCRRCNLVSFLSLVLSFQFWICYFLFLHTHSQFRGSSYVLRFPRTAITNPRLLSKHRNTNVHLNGTIATKRSKNGTMSVRLSTGNNSTTDEWLCIKCSIRHLRLSRLWI